MSHHLAGELVFSFEESRAVFDSAIHNWEPTADGVILESSGFYFELRGDYAFDPDTSSLSGTFSRLLIAHEGDAAVLEGSLLASSLRSLSQFSGTVSSFAWGDLDASTLEFSSAKTVSDFSLEFPQVVANGFELLMEANTAIVATDGDDLIEGGESSDVVYSGPGSDTLIGGDGDDVLYGEAGDDWLYGGAGDDELYGGTGADYMEGGTGSDWYYVDNVGDQVVEFEALLETEPAEDLTVQSWAELEDDIAEDIDKVFSSIDFILSQFVERLELTDSAISGTGNSLDNEIIGNAEPNILAGEGGDDLLSGGAGVDLARFNGAHSEYLIEPASAHLQVEFIVTDLQEGRDGTDALAGIERMSFTDIAYAYDIADANSAGGIYRTYQAAFARTPDQGGFGYWLAQADKGMSAVEIGERFTWSDEFMEVYGVETPSHYLEGSNTLDVVDGFYRNVLDRAPDEGGLNYYSTVIDTQEKTVGRVLAEIADSAENRESLLVTLQNGMPYDLWVE